MIVENFNENVLPLTHTTINRLVYIATHDRDMLDRVANSIADCVHGAYDKVKEQEEKKSHMIACKLASKDEMIQLLDGVARMARKNSGMLGGWTGDHISDKGEQIIEAILDIVNDYVIA